MRKIKALFINLNVQADRERDAGGREKQKKKEGEKERFGNGKESLKPSHFSWALHPVLLLWYLHTKPIRASSAAADLSSPQTREKEWATNGSVWVPGTWPEVYFPTRLVMGTEAAVQNQGSHRLTEKHRGQGLRNHESCDATVLTLMTSCCPADRERHMRETEREKAGSPSSEESQRR